MTSPPRRAHPPADHPPAALPATAGLRRAKRLWNYLNLDIPAAPADCLLVLGGHDLGVAERAADLYAGGFAPLIVASGGPRAVPDRSRAGTEADAIASVLRSRGIPPGVILLERLAANTSENFWLTAELLRDLGLDPRAFLVVAKPYAQRRALATARRRWPARQVAVTSQQTSFDDYLAGDIPAATILSMLAGEALRLDTYAATGLIDPGEPVPARLLSDARALQQAGYNSRTVPGGHQADGLQ